MPGQNFVMVRKPRVSPSERHKDPRLQKLTITQLRKKAREQGLNVSHLTDKWELVHTLVEQRMYEARAHRENFFDAKYRTIFTLPGEIRNMIYRHVLVAEEPIVARYGRIKYRTFFELELSPLKPNPIFEQFVKMSWANRELRKEVRSYFFANNRFEVRGCDEASYTKFLRDIGADGRASIAVLNLNGEAFRRYRDLFHIIKDLTSLRDLTIREHTGRYLDSDSYRDVRNSATKNDPQAKDLELKIRDNTGFLAVFPALQKVRINCAFPAWDPNWYGLWHEWKRMEVLGRVECAVLRRALKTLRGKGILVMVDSVLGAPRMASDPNCSCSTCASRT